MTIAANGLIGWTPATAGSFPVSVRASDGSLFSDQAFSIAVTAGAPLNHPPTAGNDSYTAIAHPLSSGITQIVAAPGVLANDSDLDNDALHTGNKGGSTRITLNTNGGFTLAPLGSNNSGGTTGNANFTYQALDTSNAASATANVTVSIIANRRPISVADSLTVPRCTIRVGNTSNCQTAGAGAYVPLTLNLPNNDTDPDTATIDVANQLPLSVASIRSGTSGNGVTSGSLTTNSRGIVRFTGNASTGIQVTYTPRYNFAGVNTFQYKVKDRLGLTAGNTNAQGWVNVTVTVQ